MQSDPRLVYIAGALLLATALPRTQAPASIDRVLADAVARGDIRGVVAIASDRRGVFYQGAFGYPVDALFRIASMTKPITTVAAMQLFEQGRFKLDDPAAKYLPELANLSVFESFDSRTGAYKVRPATRTLTLRHLLTHTSGLGYNFTSPIVRDFKPANGDRFPAGPLLFEPGTQWVYGTNTDWVGRLVESMSGKPLEQHFRDRILDPLAMNDTFYNVPAEKQPRLVTVYRRESDGSLGVDPNQPPVAIPRPIGGGGLSSTANDYIRFARMLLNGGALDGVRILSPETVALMSRNQTGSVSVRALKTAMPERSSDFTFVADGRDKFGLGFMITAASAPGKRSAGSLSWGGLNNTYFWVDPNRGIAGVILMQFLPFVDSKALAVYDAFERAVYQQAKEKQ